MRRDPERSPLMKLRVQWFLTQKQLADVLAVTWGSLQSRCLSESSVRHLSVSRCDRLNARLEKPIELSHETR
ncbi:MAG: hypothetical protein HC769_19840 [Cyanobacteria bacterium CRU_2_1]|nr:hypothetical protein [Cyanobacteria bacterium CRU_2_1]